MCIYIYIFFFFPHGFIVNAVKIWFTPVGIQLLRNAPTPVQLWPQKKIIQVRNAPCEPTEKKGDTRWGPPDKKVGSHY